MIKYFCDECGKEVQGPIVNEVSIDGRKIQGHIHIGCVDAFLERCLK